MGSLERANGFLVKINELELEIKRLRRAESVKVKRKVIEDLVEELNMFKGMHQTELDIYRGHIDRPPNKFILNKDGFSYRLNPKYKGE